MRVDKILELLPEVDLRLFCMQEKQGAPEARWYVGLAQAAFGPAAETYHGWGGSPLSAMTSALRQAGVNATDEP